MAKYEQKNRGVTLQIDKSAITKVTSLCLMLILSTFIYNTLRISKDALIIPLIGAEIISSLKLWAVLPVAVVFILLYSKLCMILSKKAVFVSITSFFGLFFLIFAFILYPSHQYLHPDLSHLIENFPRFKWVFLMISNWSFSLFYIMSELCGNVILTVLFWQTANALNTVNEAKKYYGTFIFFGHIGHISSGAITLFIVPLLSVFFENSISDAWEINLKIKMIIVASALIGLTFVHSWIDRNIKPENVVKKEEIKLQPKKKIPFFQSLKIITSSKYLGLIALMVICYGTSINIVEGVWKNQVKIQYPTSHSYSNFMANFQMASGFVNMIIALIAAKLIQKYSWLFCAIITPIAIFISGVLFFILISFKNEFAMLVAGSTANVVFIAVLLGSAQNIFSKAIKYSLFDMTKEMSYIPLSADFKTRGKAAADLMGHKLGKSSGAFIQWGLLTLIPGSTLGSLATYLFVIFFFIMIIWIWAVISLNREFLEKIEETI